MATTYGSFPGVQVTTAGGGITAVVLGDEENLVIFGEGDYARDGEFVRVDGHSADTADGLDSNTTSASTESPEQINARLEADSTFGENSELANAMKDALANGANIDFMYGVAVERYLREESFAGASSGTLANTPLFEDPEEVDFWDSVASVALEVRFTYDGTPTAPSTLSTGDEVVNINPFTGEWAASASSDYTVGYRSLDYSTAFSAAADASIVEEGETGIYAALSEDNTVSSALNSEVSTLRNNYQLVNALHGAEPNDNEALTDDNGDVVRYDARFDTANYTDTSVDADYFFKFAPVRQENEVETVMGGVGGLFAGNPIQDPIYNDPLSGFEGLEQSLSKSEANELRNEQVIPIRQAGSIRVKDNLSTSTSTDWERDFWRRRITDRVILIAKAVGDAIIGRINDEQTRRSAERQIEVEMRSLIDDRLLKPNSPEENNWFVDVYESSTDSDEVKIDVGFTPYGVVKRIDASVTIDT